jgi:predicted metallopeptidase
MKKKALCWNDNPELKERVKDLVLRCDLNYIKTDRIFCYESSGAATVATARIWGLGRIWQQALKVEPAYIIEVISEKFYKLGKLEQDEVLIHELLHIPKNFSGALVSHKKVGGVSKDKVRRLMMKI